MIVRVFFQKWALLCTYHLAQHRLEKCNFLSGIGCSGIVNRLFFGISLRSYQSYSLIEYFLLLFWVQDDTFLNVASFLAREEKIVPLLETANMLDEKITPNQLKACEDVFCKALQRVSDFYEEMLFQGWTENSLRCKKCGRYGHTDAKCLFKAKASRAT